MPMNETRRSNPPEYPEEVQHLVRQARQLKNEGDWTGALRLYRIALALLPRQEPLRQSLRSEIRKLVDYEDIEPFSAEAAETHTAPDLVPAWLSGVLGCVGLIVLGLVLLSGFWFLQIYIVPH